MAISSTIYLLRHTTPAIAANTCYGITDVALTASFEEEARAVIASLPPVDRIVSSPLSRCHYLARHLANHLNRPIKYDERLREFNFGSWEAQCWDSIPRAELDAWAADFMHARPHGGDSVYHFRARVTAILDELRALDGCTLVVTHGGVIKTLLASGDGAEAYPARLPFGGLCALLADHS